ncbi:class I SAM-dependent methyltransferase [Stenotrophomonas mori]|uniref:class I SAM-dependent methyltransferase n=1 Tax=Stenotrophomonas mori TaxID=2871096 RepID=UPI002020F321|nr:class I SAM-dependent methyltransferase [Stenotrophomonas mori]
MRLHRSADGRQWLGDVACSLPLPLPSEAVNAIVLQHAAGSGLDGLLSECARVLMPGGRLWLTALNRYSPYRVRWQWQDARPASLAHCRLRLRRDGLQVSARTHFGPLWHESGATGGKALPGLRAVSVIEFEKRTRALIGPEAVRAGGWRAPVAT